MAATTATRRKDPPPAAGSAPGIAALKDPALIELRQHLDQRMGGLIVDRMSFWTHWREIADYLIPRRYKWLITPNQASRGSPINQRIIDNTGTRALNVLAAGMMSGMTSPGRPWFRLILDDPDISDSPDVRLWLDEVANRMRTVLGESNFYTSLGTVLEDLGAFGTGAMVIYEDFEDVIRCYPSCAGEYFLANSDRLAVDTFYRMFVMTTAQMARKFGAANCSQTVKGALQTKGAMLSREILVAHAIEPNDTVIDGEAGVKGMPYREVYWEYGQADTQILSRRGFHECPFVTPRWSIVGNDAYGRSPGMDALGDVKQLQVEQKRKAQAIDKMVNPPMLAGIGLKNEPASLLPGGVTYSTEKDGFKPVYEVKPEIREMMEDIKECQSRIDATFSVPIFMMISQLDTVRTATEIDARKEEKLIQLGPVIERYENECLDPALNRVYSIMLRAKLLPPIPKVLQGQHVKIEYISILAQAQRAAMTVGLERVAAFVGNLVAGFPDAGDNLDVDELIDEYADHLGVSPKVIRSAIDVANMRKQRAQQQQAAQLLQQTMAGAAGAKTLSQTDVGGGANALGVMLGTQSPEKMAA